MKFRSDFVTNSSSSGFVAVKVNLKNGEALEFERDYDTGYGGYFWNGGDFEAAFAEAENGKDILKAIIRNTEGKEFVEWALNNVETAFRDRLLKIESVSEIKNIKMWENTRYDDGDEQDWDINYRYSNEDEDDNDSDYDDTVYFNHYLSAGEPKEPIIVPDTNNPEKIEVKDKIFVSTSCYREGTIKSFVTKHGGIYKDNFVVKLDYLIVNTENMGWETEKLRRAKEQIAKGRDVKIFHENDFVQIIIHQRIITEEEKLENERVERENKRMLAEKMINENIIGYGFLLSMMAVVNSCSIDNKTRLRLEKIVISKEVEQILGTDLLFILSTYETESTSVLRKSIKELKANYDKNKISEICDSIKKSFPENEEVLNEFLNIVVSAIKEK